MIGKATRGSKFSGLLRYLTQQADARVIGIQNLPNFDPGTSTRLMQLTADGSQRTRRPVYHLSIRTRPHDRVLSDDEWIAVANTILGDMALQEHQAVFVRHGDPQSDHIHLAVNRVHPRTLHAAPLRNDFAKIEKRLRKIESELDLDRLDTTLGNSVCPAKTAKRRQGEFQERRRQGWSRTDKIKQATLHALGQARLSDKDKMSDAFSVSLGEFGCALAKGDRRGIVIVASDGSIASFSRCVLDTAERRQITGSVTRDELPSIEIAIAKLKEREQNLLGDIRQRVHKDPSSPGLRRTAPTRPQKSILEALVRGIGLAEEVSDATDSSPNHAGRFRLSTELKHLLWEKQAMERRRQRAR